VASNSRQVAKDTWGDEVKVLFLDIDGVLNSRKYFAMGVPVNDRIYLADNDYARMIDPEAVELLNEVIDRTGARIVVSSSWRQAFDTFADLRACLLRAGIRRCIVSRTPFINAERHKEVERWLMNPRCMC
jgi:hypothetical protein